MRYWRPFLAAIGIFALAIAVNFFDAGPIKGQEQPVLTNRVNKFTAGQQFTTILQAGPAANTTTTPANGYGGIVTLAANTATVTFPTAYTVVPICFATDQTTAQLVKAAPTTTTVVISDTVGATDVIAWACFGNPN